MATMERARFQLSISAMLGLVACVAVNIWLFRYGALLGLVGLNISKHIIIAYVCQILGVDRTKGRARASLRAARPAGVPVS